MPVPSVQELLRHVELRWWGLSIGAPARPEKSGRTLPHELCKRIDAFERETQTLGTQVPVRHSMWWKQKKSLLSVKKNESWYVASTAMHYAKRAGIFGAVGYGTYTVLNHSSLVVACLAGAAADADIRKYAAKVCLMPHASSGPAAPIEAEDALAMPGHFHRAPGAAITEKALPAAPQPTVAAAAPPLAPRRVAAQRQASAASTAFVRYPTQARRPERCAPGMVDVGTRIMRKASAEVDASFGPQIFDLDKNLAVVTPLSWQQARPGQAAVDTESYAHRVSQLATATARCREQVQRQRELSAEQQVAAARSRTKARVLSMQQQEAEQLGQPTMLYRMMVGGVLLGTAVVMGAALGTIASVVFVFPGAYLMLGALTARTRQDASAEARGQQCKERKERALGHAHGHAWWAEQTASMASYHAALWQKGAALSAQLSTHLPTDLGDVQRTEKIELSL